MNGEDEAVTSNFRVCLKVLKIISANEKGSF
jgi:hypothetical protein